MQSDNDSCNDHIALYDVRVSIVIKDQNGKVVDYSLQGLNKVNLQLAAALKEAAYQAARINIQSTYERPLRNCNE